MGLFSFVGKAVKALGKVAAPVLKAVASKATGGLSDSILKKVKGNPGKLSPTQAEALIEKTGGYVPKVRTTESRQEGWGFGKSPGRKSKIKRKPKQSRPPRPPPGGYMDDAYDEGRRAAGLRTPRRAPKRAKKRSTKPAKARSARKPPTGGLDLRALSASWKAAGKPGTWQGWIQANK